MPNFAKPVRGAGFLAKMPHPGYDNTSKRRIEFCQTFCQNRLGQEMRESGVTQTELNYLLMLSWRGDRAAEGAALEMLCGSNLTKGSNPFLSVLHSCLLDVSCCNAGQPRRGSSRVPLQSRSSSNISSPRGSPAMAGSPLQLVRAHIVQLLCQQQLPALCDGRRPLCSLACQAPVLRVCFRCGATTFSSPDDWTSPWSKY